MDYQNLFLNFALSLSMTKLDTIYKAFPNESDAIKFLEKELWDNVPKCPYCNTSFNTPIKNELRYHCNKCNSNFSVTVRTLFHRSKVDLRKWFYCLLIPDIKAISLRDLGEELSVTKDTASKMINRMKAGYLNNRDLIIAIHKKFEP